MGRVREGAAERRYRRLKVGDACQYKSKVTGHLSPIHKPSIYVANTQCLQAPQKDASETVLQAKISDGGHYECFVRLLNSPCRSICSHTRNDLFSAQLLANSHNPHTRHTQGTMHTGDSQMQ